MEFLLVTFWLAVYLTALAIGMILLDRCLPMLADRGAGIAIPAVLAMVWLVAFVVGRISITLGVVLGVAVVLALAAAAAWAGDARLDADVFVRTAAVFSIAFLFMVALRAIDPGAHPVSGEKFHDYALLRSLLGVQTIPPEDVWFAGEPVQYYYGGHFLASILARLTVTPAAYAYNLALAGFFATYVTGAYGLARSLVDDNPRLQTASGLVAASTVGLASNLQPMAALIAWLLPEPVASVLAEVGGFELEGLAAGIGGFSPWTASRVIPETITEFPLFAWLNGDLHAHMMSTTVTLLAVGLLLAYYRTPVEDRWRRRLILLAVGPVAGVVGVTNTWSFPTIGGLVALSVALAPASPYALLSTALDRRAGSWPVWQREAGRGLLAGLAATAVLAVGYVVTWPFWGLVSGGGRSIAFWPEHTALGPLALVHGLFVLTFAVFLWRYLRAREGRVVMAAELLVVGCVALGTIAPVLFGLGPAAIFGSDGILGALGHVFVPGVAVFGPLIVLGVILARSATVDDRPSPGFEAVAIVGGAGLALLVELVYLQDNATSGRYNTVFRVYSQVWLLFALALGPTLVQVVADALPEPRPSYRGIETLTDGARAAIVVLFAASLIVYAPLAVGGQVTSPDRFGTVEEPTLDATAFIEEHHAEEAGAIAYLDTEVSGMPTMITHPGGYYEWANAPSTFSGVPTVAGASITGIYFPDRFDQRKRDVERMFTGEASTQRRLLDEYDVALIYVGPAEREAYGGDGSAITIGDRSFVEVVPESRDWPAVTLYRVTLDSSS